MTREENEHLRHDMALRSQIEDCERRVTLKDQQLEETKADRDRLLPLLPALAALWPVLKPFQAFGRALNSRNPHEAVAVRSMDGEAHATLEVRHFVALNEWLEKHKDAGK